MIMYGLLEGRSLMCNDENDDFPPLLFRTKKSAMDFVEWLDWDAEDTPKIIKVKIVRLKK